MIRVPSDDERKAARACITFAVLLILAACLDGLLIWRLIAVGAAGVDVVVKRAMLILALLLTIAIGYILCAWRIKAGNRTVAMVVLVFSLLQSPFVLFIALGSAAGLLAPASLGPSDRTVDGVLIIPSLIVARLLWVLIRALIRILKGHQPTTKVAKPDPKIMV